MDAIFLFFEMQISGRAPSSSFCLLSLFFSGGKSKHSLEVNPPKHGMMLTPFLLEFKNQTQDWDGITSLCVFVTS